MSKKNILIAGDSWACGEWNNAVSTKPIVPGKPIGLSHLGFEQYLKDRGYRVCNTAIGGGSNKRSINELRFHLDVQKWRYIFWFQTDPFRDVDLLEKKFTTFDELLTLQNYLLDEDYAILNTLNTQIFCIGGCSKLNLALLEKYNNLIPLIPSVIEFLIPNFTHPLVWFSGDWFKKLPNSCNKQTVDKLLDQWNLIDQLQHHRYFENDNWHPDREGHRKIFVHVTNKLKM